MIGLKSKYMYIVSGCIMIFSFFGYVFGSSPSFDTYVSDITQSMMNNSSDIFSLQGLIQRYCTSVLNTNGFVYDGFVYDPKQSAFVFLLCKDVGKASGFSPYFTKFQKKGDQGYFKRITFEELGIKDLIMEDGQTIDRCHPLRNDCDVTTILPNLFNAIINDYVNLKQPNLYGVNGFSLDEQAKIFSIKYFQHDICDSKNIFYYHKKTCRILKGYLKNAQNILSDARIFQSSSLLESAKTFPDIISRGLYDDKNFSLLGFANLLYNELFYYRLFVAYHAIMIKQYPQLLRNVDVSADKILSKFALQYDLSKQAISLTLRMMRDIYVAFPFHIGFLMYQESLDGFGKILARIATPIYTLYDKLRNVQNP